MNRCKQVLLLIQRMGVHGIFHRTIFEFFKKIGIYRWRFPVVSAPRELPSNELSSGQIEFLAKKLYVLWPAALFDGANDKVVSHIDHKAASAAAVCDADKIISGHCQWFGRIWFRFSGGADWYKNPVTAKSIPMTKHWSDLCFDDPETGDLKFILEPHRFGWAVILARAYAATGNETYAEYFWSMFMDWFRWNPPAGGVAYICGQECALRVISCSFAVSVFLKSSQTTPERLAAFADLIRAHEYRIHATRSYALSQKNNHSLSEAAGVVVSRFLTGSFPAALDLRFTGKHNKPQLEKAIAAFTEECERLIYDDGSFVQESFRYHRLALQLIMQVYPIAKRFANDHDDHDEYKEYKEYEKRLRIYLFRMAEYLLAFIDPSTGAVPNIGANDGAWILPLHENIDDFRPAVQSAYGLLGRPLPFADGIWNEDVAWRGVDILLHADSESVCFRNSDAATHPIKARILLQGGAALLTQKNLAGAGNRFAIEGMNRSLLRYSSVNRFAREEDRMHVDLWADGLNFALDAGTFSYYGAACRCDEEDRFANHELSRARYHNLVTIGGGDVLSRQGLFFWDDSVRTRLCFASTNGSIGYMEASHPDWSGLGIHYQRGVMQVALPSMSSERGNASSVRGVVWWIRDCLTLQQIKCNYSDDLLPYRLHWLLADGTCSKIQDGHWQIKWGGRLWDFFVFCHRCVSGGNEWQPCEAMYDWVRAEPHSLRGWHCPTYGVKSPAWSFSACSRQPNVCFDTVIIPADEQFSVVSVQNAGLIIGDHDSWEISATCGDDLMANAFAVFRNGGQQSCWQISKAGVM